MLKIVTRMLLPAVLLAFLSGSGLAQQTKPESPAAPGQPQAEPAQPETIEPEPAQPEKSKPKKKKRTVRKKKAEPSDEETPSDHPEHPQ